LDTVKARSPFEQATRDQLAEAHGEPDQHGSLADRGDHIRQIRAQRFEQFIGDRLRSFEKGIVAGMAGVIAIACGRDRGLRHG